MKQISPDYGIELSPPAEAFDVEPQITVRHSHEGMQVAAVGDRYRFLALSGETNGRYAVWEATIYPGGGPPPHVHGREEEGFLILDGRIAFQVSGRKHVAESGSFANMPTGIEHAFRNETDTVAKLLILVAPGGLEAMFQRTGRALGNADEKVLPPTEAEIKKLLRIAPEYGIEMRVGGHT